MTAIITAPVMGATALLPGPVEQGSIFSKPFLSGGTRTERLARLKALDDAGYNQHRPARTKSAEDDLMDLVERSSVDDLATLPLATLKHIEGIALRRAALAELGALPQDQLERTLAAMDGTTRRAVLELAAAYL